MAASTRSYRRTTTVKSSPGDGDDAALRSKLEQARQQRTAFYRRLADTGSRVQDAADDDDVELDAGETATRRRRQRMDMTSSPAPPHSEVMSYASSAQSSLVDPLPEPRSR